MNRASPFPGAEQRRTQLAQRGTAKLGTADSHPLATAPEMHSLSRRDWLAASAASAAGLTGLAGSTSAIAQTHNKQSKGNAMTSAARIDVHQHVFPPNYAETMGKHGVRVLAPMEVWSPEGAIAMMDATEIQTGMLSISIPGTYMGEDKKPESRAFTRQVNEWVAGVVQSRPDRFGLLACIPLPDVEGALQAVAHAYDDLSADGVILYANVAGTYLGDARFDPVMAELNRRKAVVLVHPGPLPGKPVDGIFPPLADFLLDTVRAAINMRNAGVLRRYPDLKIILSHGGGFLPFSVHRIAHTLNALDPSVNIEAVVAEFSAYYFDTAISATPTALPSLMSFAQPGRVLFGSDWPYMRRNNVGIFGQHIDRYPGFDAQTRQAVNRGNAEQLFPRLINHRG